jgi:3-oxoacyl-[acyl-carrier protein] reductase
MEGRVAVVTGASRGIGKGIVICLAEEGAAVLFTDVSSERGLSCEEEFRARGLEVSFLLADTSSATDTEAMARAALEKYGRIDVLCPNAGIFPQTLIEDISEQEWDEVCAVNLKGPFLAAKACLGQMKRQRYGRIVITSSVTGPSVSSPGHGHYAATKSGVLGFMRTAALEWAPYGITINAVEPGSSMPKKRPCLWDALVRPRTSAGWFGSWRPMKPNISPARSSWLTAARRCPRCNRRFCRDCHDGDRRNSLRAR